MSYYAIQTQELERSFKTIRAVDKVSLSIETGSVFGFLGPNGAGKTTTIRLLLGLIEPDGGEASVLGYDVFKHSDKIRENSGALLENNGLYERLTAEDNLNFYGQIWHLSSTDRRTRIQTLLSRFGLWDRRQEVVQGWSRGMKQKLAVARCLLHRPRIVFLDEPTAGLDPVSAASLRDDLAGLAEQEGVTIFLTTHNLAEAERLCHQVGVIRKGKLVAVDTPEDLRARRGAPFLEIHGSGFTESLLSDLRTRSEVISASTHNGTLVVEYKGESTAPIINFLVSNGTQVEEVRREKASLEDVFLKLMEEES